MSDVNEEDLEIAKAQAYLDGALESHSRILNDINMVQAMKSSRAVIHEAQQKLARLTRAKMNKEAQRERAASRSPHRS